MDTESWHGTPNGYNNKHCRCDSCRVAWNEYCRDRRRNRLNQSPDSHNLTSYWNGCRCSVCRQAGSDYNRQKRYSSEQATNQSNQCECCGDTPARGTVLDHDHVTGQFRGWLCSSCNTGIGKLGDSIEGLERAITYLRGAS